MISKIAANTCIYYLFYIFRLLTAISIKCVHLSTCFSSVHVKCLLKNILKVIFTSIYIVCGFIFVLLYFANVNDRRSARIFVHSFSNQNNCKRQQKIPIYIFEKPRKCFSNDVCTTL